MCPRCGATSCRRASKGGLAKRLAAWCTASVEAANNRLQGLRASGTTRDAAYSQYRDYFDSIGGRWDDGMQNDFDNLWRQSAEASEFGGAGLDNANSFAANFEAYKPRLQQRWQGEDVRAAIKAGH